jgi:tRNA (mo5U34)-methyltransferase
MVALTPPTRLTTAEIRERVLALGDWFHNLDLAGVPTAPHHFLGDYPAVKWRTFSHALPTDLSGASVLDIGCNAGFYSFELKRRGAARVLGIDSDERYLAQAQLAAEVHGLDVEFRQLPVWQVGKLGERFDIVLFLGVLYHLRHPLLALDLLHEHVVKDTLVFQSLQRGSVHAEPVSVDYPFHEDDVFERGDYPKLHFVEHRFASDPTNWWIPNAACSMAMLRSARFDVVSRPESEVYVCKRRSLDPLERSLVALPELT